MGRRKRRSDSSDGERDTTVIASNKLLTRTLYSLLPEIEDRRLYNPGPARARGLSKLAAQVGLKPDARPVRSKGSYTPDVFRFNNPKHVAVCVRRKNRREVLFAFKRTGKGARVKRRRRNEFSDVSCR